MRYSIQSIFLILTLSLVSFGCQSDPIEVNFEEITDQGVAVFSVYNHTDQDYTKMEFEVTYLNDMGDTILVDTISYEMADDSPNQIFLEANGQTIFSQGAPENTVTASGRAISSVIAEDL